jgi:hypothetical protein
MGLVVCDGFGYVCNAMIMPVMAMMMMMMLMMMILLVEFLQVYLLKGFVNSLFLK